MLLAVIVVVDVVVVSAVLVVVLAVAVAVVVGLSFARGSRFVLRLPSTLNSKSCQP